LLVGRIGSKASHIVDVPGEVRSDDRGGIEQLCDEQLVLRYEVLVGLVLWIARSKLKGRYQLTALYLGISTHMTSGGTPYVLPPHLEQNLSFTGLRTKDWSSSTLQELELSSDPT
jgi:hypothetical protein